MKRVQLQLPDAVLAWVDAQADGIESRASFIRRTLVGVMKAEQRCSVPGSAAPSAAVPASSAASREPTPPAAWG